MNVNTKPWEKGDFGSCSGGADVLGPALGPVVEWGDGLAQVPAERSRRIVLVLAADEAGLGQLSQPVIQDTNSVTDSITTGRSRRHTGQHQVETPRVRLTTWPADESEDPC